MADWKSASVKYSSAWINYNLAECHSATQQAASCATVTRSIPEAISPRILRITSFEPQPRFLVTFFVQIMQQIRRGIFGKLPGQFIQAREHRQQVGLGIRGGHRFNRGVE